MGLLGPVYKLIGRRFSTLFASAIAGAYVFDYSLNKGTNMYWEKVNEGKLWKDVKLKVLQQEAAGEVPEKEDAGEE
ncbi:ubiquinol-cytochrome C reductase, UQCRX/QCR9 like domain-containing protein [Ditylenchus destructor]|uniref:Complex III subunit 9 n=1 Tax=Ditylenchus destructor TaxID=166010 RepID=A0AAD4N8N7_9BILA|nr:ubiquinol-cytochrome C reductase, UQCRX/QCR9 like domain-containing protein [Ditylenchus destructor]